MLPEKDLPSILMRLGHSSRCADQNFRCGMCKNNPTRMELPRNLFFPFLFSPLQQELLFSAQHSPKSKKSKILRRRKRRRRRQTVQPAHRVRLSNRIGWRTDLCSSPPVRPAAPQRTGANASHGGPSQVTSSGRTSPSATAFASSGSAGRPS